jgi:Raf kinase inhibitor-like YbhB/YbcL family protein
MADQADAVSWPPMIRRTNSVARSWQARRRHHNSGSNDMAEQGFTLTSPAFTSDGSMPAELTCDGANRPPVLKWIHPPRESRSFALIADDPDAPGGTFTHWIVFNIPGDVDRLPGESGNVGVLGRNDFQYDGYGGPCPPPNHGEHRYYFTLYALDVDSLNLRPGALREELEKAMQGHILAHAATMGRYRRRAG